MSIATSQPTHSRFFETVLTPLPKSRFEYEARNSMGAHDTLKVATYKYLQGNFMKITIIFSYTIADHTSPAITNIVI